MTEELASGQIFTQGGAIEGDERVVCPDAVEVDGPGDQFLACAGFTPEKHGGSRILDLFDHPVDCNHRLTVADDIFEPVFSAQLAFQKGIACRKFPLFQGLFHDQTDVVDVKGLGDVILRPGFHGHDRRVDGAVGGNHDDADIGLVFLGRPQHIHAVHSRKFQIRYDQLVIGCFELFQRAFSFSNGVDPIAFLTHDVLQRIPHFRVVFDDQNPVSLHKIIP